ncbi:MAG: type I-U CRISPR-associated protein Csb2, partial [Planctomycetota bacterium]
MALAAAHFETGADPGERAALEWLEVQRPPTMRFADTEARAIVTNYVPVNDVEISDQLRRKCAKPGVQPGKDDVAQAVALLPERRPKQGRTFPRVWLHDDTVYLTWDATPSPNDRQALEALCRKVTRIGHSSSLVQVWVEADGEAIQPRFVPTGELADMRLRGTAPGLLNDLAARFRQTEIEEFHRLTAECEAAPTKKRQREIAKVRQERFPTGRPIPQRPVLGIWVAYSRVRETVPPAGAAGPFSSDILVLRKVETVSLCPPTTAECMPVPISVFRRWMRGDDRADAALADVQGGVPGDTESADHRADHRRRAVAWRGLEKSRIVTSEDQVQPGDTLVLPVEAGGWECFGHIPEATPGDQGGEPSPARGVDRAEESRLCSQRGAILRLHPTIMKDWPETDSLLAIRTMLDSPDPLSQANDIKGHLKDYAAELAATPDAEAWEWLQKLAAHMARRKVSIAAYPPATQDENDQVRPPGIVFQGQKLEEGGSD